MKYRHGLLYCEEHDSFESIHLYKGITWKGDMGKKQCCKILFEGAKMTTKWFNDNMRPLVDYWLEKNLDKLKFKDESKKKNVIKGKILSDYMYFFPEKLEDYLKQCLAK